MITTADIHWLAGFLDGEGYFGIQRSSPRIAVVQKDIWPVEKVQQLIGGKMYYVAGSCKPGRMYYALHITGKRAIGLMMTLYSLLSPRRQEKIAGILARWRVIPLRGQVNREKTHCHRGHEFSVENTRYQKGGGRDCKECMKIHQTKYLLKLKALQQQGAN